MPEEEKVSQDNQPVAEPTATHADLDSAYKELLAEAEPSKDRVVAKPEKEAKALTPEEEERKRDHDERSQLGRKVKTLEQTISENQRMISEMRDMLQQSLTPKKETQDEIPEYVGTASDVEKIIEAREHKIAQRQKEQASKYESSYITSLRSMKSDDPDALREEITKELFDINSPFNQVVTGDPIADVRINYAEAKNAIIMKKIANRPKPNVRGGGKGAVSTNLSIGASEDSRSISLSDDLDEISREFVNKTGMSEESQIDALKGETPFHLTGIRR